MQFSSKMLALLLVFAAFVFFVPFIGNAHLFDWDEINFAEISREMVVTGNYAEPQINFTSFTEKPPLFFWLQAICMNIFGVNEFAARLPNAILGIIVLPFLFLVGKKLKDKKFGLIWSLVYFGTILPHLYFKSGIIDPWFNFFIFCGIICLITASWEKSFNRNNWKWLIVSGVLSGLAVLTKGPVAILVTGLLIALMIISKRFRFFLSIQQLIAWLIITLLTAGLWLGVNYLQNGSSFINEFTIRQWELFSRPDAGHKGFFIYHFIVIFFGCFPASVFMIHAFALKEKEDKQLADFKKWMVVLFWLVLILFTIVTTKIVHYSSLCYYPLSFLAAYSIYHIIHKATPVRNWTKALLVFSAFPFIAAPFAFVYAGTQVESIKHFFNKDQFALENLQANVHWSGWEFLPGLVLLILLLFFIFYFKKFKEISLIALFAGTAIYVQLALFFLINRIEAYSQKANIEFWESKSGEDCYYISYGYKTYTYYFYGLTKPHSNKNYANKEWLMRGEIDKPVYISTKPNKLNKLKEEIPDAVFLYNKNGFYFFKRSPGTK